MKRIGSIVIVFLFIVFAAYLLLTNTAGSLPISVKNPLNNPEKTITQPKNGKPLTNGINVPEGYTISIFAEDLGKARDLEFTPDGTLLVSSPSQDAVYALPDRNNDGIADEAKAVVTDSNNLHGLAFHKGKLYVASTNVVKRYNWDEASLTATNGEEILSLPGGGNHTSRTITFDNENRMYVSIGSTCNVCFEDSDWIAAVITADENGGNAKLFAKGLRNAPFLTRNPDSGAIWVTEMGRDFLGDTLPPDEINILQNNGDYGWPICYGNKVYDRDFGEESPSYCATTLPPAFEIPAHSAPLGLTFIESNQFPEEWQGDLLVSYHGSWNRSVPDGYKVVRMDVSGNTISEASDFITGFIQGSDIVGRPVDVIFAQDGTLYISDDRTGVVYKVTGS